MWVLARIQLSSEVKELKKKYLLFLGLVVLGAVFLIMKFTDEQGGGDNDSTSRYTVDLERWGIYNDGTHPKETTEGLNKALLWASRNDYNTFYIPAGTYLIDKGQEPSDPNARLNMVSDLTLELADEAILKKETNSYESYEIVYVGPETKNVSIKGGTFQGDRDTHDYTGKDTSHSHGTHEFGMGILALGTDNLKIEDVKTINFTGDGIMVGGSSKQINRLKESDFELGAIGKKGELIADSTKIRTKGNVKTNFQHPVFDVNRVIQLSRPKNMNANTPYDIFFYRSDGTFIQKVENQELDWSMVNVPEQAAYFHAVFDTEEIAGVELEYWNKDISNHVEIKHSESANNRRQGITVAGVSNMEITQNKIHNIKGIAPQSGIDIEAGFYPNYNILIKENRIYNNERYNIILYDGQDVTVDENYLGPNKANSSIGLAIATSFRSGAVIKNNTFDASKIVAEGEAVFRGNRMSDSLATIFGPDTLLTDMEFTNSQLSIQSKEPYGVEVSNITLANDRKQINSLQIKDQPIKLSDVTITGETVERNIVGEAADGSIFNRLKVIDYNATYGLDLPRGTYNGCEFASSELGKGRIDLNSSGNYEFNDCVFKQIGDLHVDNTGAEAVIQSSQFESATKIPIIRINKAKEVAILDNVIYTEIDSTSIKEWIYINENTAPHVKQEGNTIKYLGN